MLSIGVILAIVVAGTSAVSVKLHPLSDAFIAHINSKQSSWTAGRNFPLNTPLRKLVGAHPKSEAISLRKVEHDADLIASLPENFDPRDKWPHCPTLNEIRDQASCGSCWAFGAVEAMTDRACILGQKQFHFSAEDLISCCDVCGDCQGGMIELAWLYWFESGLVSGGNYDTNQGCKPYPFPTCKTLPHPPLHPTGFNVSGGLAPCVNYDDVETPKCSDKCVNEKLSYNKDKWNGQEPYSVEGEDNMKAELFTNGPIESAFLVYEDFFSYKSGVYRHVKGDLIYGHAIKILGWGVENGVKYWLVANSWNESFGDNGFFKILRGEDHLGIESRGIAAIPDVY